GQPWERLSYMMEDAGVGVVVTREKNRGVVAGGWGVVVGSVDGEEREAIEGESREGLGEEGMGGELGDVVYTSGGSGKGEGGGGVREGGWGNCVEEVGKKVRVRRGWKWGWVTTVGADLGNTGVYVGLGSGGELHVYGEEEGKSGWKLGGRVREEGMDCLKVT